MATAASLPMAHQLPHRGALRILIADDQQLQLRRLKLSLNCMPQVELVFEAVSAAQFRRAVRAHRPNLVISDARVGDASLFDLMAELANEGLQPEIIFLTDAHEHAVRAFEIGAVDYLQKQSTFERLCGAVQRAEARIWTKSATNRFSELQKRIHDLEMSEQREIGGHTDKLWFKNGCELAQIDVDEVEWFQAAGDYVIAHTPTHSHMLGQSISGLEACLDPVQVLRVHRSSLVNLRRIRSMRKRRPRGLVLVLGSGKQVAVGPKFESCVLSHMNAPRWR